MAGCIGDDGPRESVQGSHAHGHFYVCPDGTEIDPGVYTGHHDDDFDPTAHCPAPDEPAKLVLRAHTQQVVRFDEVSFVLDLTPAGHGEGSVETLRLLARQGGASATAADHPVEIVNLSGANAPLSEEATWAPQEAGTWTVRAFASIDGQQVMSPPIEVLVDEVEPTGTVHEIKITGTGPTARLEAASIDMVVGDAVVFVNDDVVEQRVNATSSAELEFDYTLPAGERSDALVVYVLGEQPFLSMSAFAANTGKLVVSAPA